MQYYRVVGYRTLADALHATFKQQEQNKPWIIAGLNGYRYYLFRSSANLGQQIFKVATHKVAVNMQKYFVKANSGIKWRAYYREKFGVAQQWDDVRVTAESAWLNLTRMCPDILMLCNALQNA